MTTEIVHRPEDLTYEEFHRIDEECFPKEPADRGMWEAASDFWAAKRDGRLVGYSYLKTTPDVAWIARVGVATAKRNRGIGHRLMEAMLEQCRRIPRHDVLLYVMQDNAAAIHLYRKCGFEISEESWQYVVPVGRLFESHAAGTRGKVTARSVVDLPNADRPSFSGQWAGLEDQHDPPEAHVLVFFGENGERIGHCRLSPGFPGCFPFEVAEPALRLAGALEAIRPLLSAEHDVLKLLIGDPQLADACAESGFRLNFSLYKMTADLRA